MKFPIFALASVVSMGAWADSSYRVQIDKGSLYVEFDPQISEANITFENPNHCASKLKIDKKSNILELAHTGDPCPSGLKIKAVLPFQHSIEITHGGGFISVENTTSLTNSASSIDAYTNGLVTTEVDAIKLDGRYAPNAAHFSNSNRKLPRIIIRLSGGVIQFQR